MARAIASMAVATLLLASDARAQEISSAPSLQIASSPPGDDAQAGASERRSRAIEGHRQEVEEEEPRRRPRRRTPATTRLKRRSSRRSIRRGVPIPAIKIDFKARIETEIRGATPASGFEDGAGRLAGSAHRGRRHRVQAHHVRALARTERGLRSSARSQREERVERRVRQHRVNKALNRRGAAASSFRSAARN